MYWRVGDRNSESLVTVEWDVPSDADAGTYRLTHTGYHKAFGDVPEIYTGVSDTFVVV